MHPPRQTFLPTPLDAIAPLAYVDEPPELLLERDPEGDRQEATESRPPRTVALIPHEGLPTLDETEASSVPSPTEAPAPTSSSLVSSPIVKMPSLRDPDDEDPEEDKSDGEWPKRRGERTLTLLFADCSFRCGDW